MSTARKKASPTAVLPTPPATTPTAVAPAPTITATPIMHMLPTTTPTTTTTTTTVTPHASTTPAPTGVAIHTPIQPHLQPIKPLQPIQAQPTQKIQPAPMPPSQPIPIPIQPNTTAATTSTHTLQTTYHQTLNFQQQQLNGAPQTIAPSQLLPSPAPTTQTPQTQKQLRTQKKPKAAAQAQTPAVAGTGPQQKPRKQSKRTVKRAAPAPTATQPILPRPAKGGGRPTKITAEEIQLVQSLIEKCLQLYMNQTEVITALHLQAHIEPSFTNLVWQKLEEQNPDFFKAYHIRLRIKEQITAFNYLVSQQAQLMQKAGTFVPGLNPAGAASGPVLQPSLSPLVGSPQTVSYLPPYAPLPQLPSLQALAAQTPSPGLTATHPTPIAPRVTQTTTTRNPTLSPQTNGLMPQTTFVPSMPVESLSYNFGSTGQAPTFSEELKDDTPITEDIDTNQFFLSES